ncbi:uncharacterized protein LOC123530174 [Mercenaria mercenaria]|uniref:uncharacterized protein LOC123530174 n=1 Tax=Mercenaria mercenaria TaxID=6596 RepID=UPI00234EAAE3|nr:uncharacterized protein LOC123530174 [Mercenaria mercenaria]XP_053378121.1 uncharacterized protein LOC123530174 [Mercenaria mercenaria]
MAKILFLFLHGCVLQLAIARLDLELTSSNCGNYYDMKDIDEAYVTYNGGWLGQYECSVEFLNYQTFSKQTCIKPINFHIGCTTEVEYHRHFISKYLDPEKLYTCRNASLEEWCGPMRTTRFHLLIRTPASFSDNIKMHVYLKYYPGSDDGTSSALDTSSSTGLVGVLVFVILIIFIGGIIACNVARQRKRQALPRTPYAYQTGGQTGNVTQAQPLTGYNPAQPSQLHPTVQGGYQFHPMQSAYPVPQQQGYSPVTGNQTVTQTDIVRQSPFDVQGRFTNPSAPPNANADPPPSYESVMK